MPNHLADTTPEQRAKRVYCDANPQVWSATDIGVIQHFLAQLRDADGRAGERLGELSIQASITDRLNTFARELGVAEKTDYQSLTAVQQHLDSITLAYEDRGRKASGRAGALGELRAQKRRLEADYKHMEDGQRRSWVGSWLTGIRDRIAELEAEG